MGNAYSTGNVYQRHKNTIEIIMADEIDDYNENNNNLPIENQTDKNQMVKSNSSLTSIMSITSSTQTEPDLFTQWPQKKFIFGWLNKLKNYQTLLSKSQQLLYSSSFFNSNLLSKRKLQVRYISLSTQTINKMSDYSLNTNIVLFSRPRFSKVQEIKSSITDETTSSTGSNIQVLNLQNDVILEENLIFEEVLSEKEAVEKESLNLPSECSEISKMENNEIENDYKIELLSDINNEVNNSDKASPIKKKQRLMSHDNILSNLTNKYYRSEIRSKLSSIPHDHLKSSDSLTSITWLSKPDNTSLIFKSNGKAYRHRKNKGRKMKKKCISTDMPYIKKCKIGLKKNSNENNHNSSKLTELSEKSKKNSNNSPLSFNSNNLLENIHYSDDEYHHSKVASESENKISILSYRFWINSCNKNWDTFHNPTDRRIESIGRLSKCRIQLTNLIIRHSNGLLKQQVIIYAPNHSAMEKCCKLFDDKFPEFYASSGLLRILYYRRGSHAINNLLRDCRTPDRINIPITNTRIRRRKRKALKNYSSNSELGFIKNELMKY